MKILAIETSCDETSASVVEIKNNKSRIISNVINSQINIHQQYGGVVPEVAAREHNKNILPVVKAALKQTDLSKPQVDFLAVANGPGLITSLHVGVQTAKTLAYLWDIPLVAVNHVEAHVLANMHPRLDISLPAICLIVSGGHTQLVLIKKVGHYQTIGETRDDAAGEAFDKAAKLMGLGYPGGPVISRLAKEAESGPSVFSLPRPMIDSRNFDFSFSGLKTAIYYEVKKIKKMTGKIQRQLAAEFQQSVIDVLILKTVKAAQKFEVQTVMLAGGVAANQELRKQLRRAVKKFKINYQVPSMQLTTDNAAMVGLAAYFKAKQGKVIGWQRIKADPSLGI